MYFINEWNEEQVYVIVPFEKLKADLISALKAELQGIQQEPQLPEEPQRKFYTPAEVREMFQISRSTLHNWKHQGILVPCKIGGKVLYEKNAVHKVYKKKTG
ncbi:MAG: helix-turn-helix domain-containing protein [Bacteroidetes bacterium]|nr:helix-turn-helix domain-containing protein [Bacteroidota bacterium]